MASSVHQPHKHQPIRLAIVRALRRAIAPGLRAGRASARLQRIDRRLALAELSRVDLCRWRAEVWRQRGAKIGKNCRFYSLEIFTEPQLVEIGDDVIISGQVMLITHDGAIYTVGEPIPHVSGHYGRIRIGSNCFIGMGAMILQNVEIGDHSIVAAGAVVMDSFPPNSVIAGNPATYVCPTSMYMAMKRRSPHTICHPDYPFPNELPVQLLVEKVGQLPFKTPRKRPGAAPATPPATAAATAAVKAPPGPTPGSVTASSLPGAARATAGSE